MSDEKKHTLEADDTIHESKRIKISKPDHFSPEKCGFPYEMRNAISVIFSYISIDYLLSYRSICKSWKFIIDSLDLENQIESLFECLPLAKNCSEKLSLRSLMTKEGLPPIMQVRFLFPFLFTRINEIITLDKSNLNDHIIVYWHSMSLAKTRCDCINKKFKFEDIKINSNCRKHFQFGPSFIFTQYYYTYKIKHDCIGVYYEETKNFEKWNSNSSKIKVLNPIKFLRLIRKNVYEYLNLNEIFLEILQLIYKGPDFFTTKSIILCPEDQKRIQRKIIRHPHLFKFGREENQSFINVLI